jgi:hypothetical protein
MPPGSADITQYNLSPPSLSVRMKFSAIIWKRHHYLDRFTICRFQKVSEILNKKTEQSLIIQQVSKQKVFGAVLQINSSLPTQIAEFDPFIVVSRNYIIL